MKLSGELVNTAHEKIDCQQAVDFFIGRRLGKTKPPAMLVVNKNIL